MNGDAMTGARQLLMFGLLWMVGTTLYAQTAESLDTSVPQTMLSTTFDAERGAWSPPAEPSTNTESEAETPRPGFFQEQGAARSMSVAEERGIDVDANQIREAQNEALAAQAESEDAVIVSTNAMTLRMDRIHDRLFRLMDNSVRTVDLRWMQENADYEPELSTFELGLLTRVGGRGDDGSFEIKGRFGADVAFPGLESRLHLIFDNEGRDDLPGTDPMQKEDDLRLGVRTIWDSFWGDQWDLSGGVRWRSSGPVAYGELEWKWSRDWLKGKIRFSPRGFYYTDDGFGQKAVLDWTRHFTPKKILQLVSAESSNEKDSGARLEETVRLGLLRSGKGRGWVFQVSVFPNLHDEGRNYIDDVLVNVSWRDALYRKWIYYTITPQVDFADEDGHDPKPSLRISFDILFGGTTDHLM